MDRSHYPEGEDNHCISCHVPFPCPTWHVKHHIEEIDWLVYRTLNASWFQELING